MPIAQKRFVLEIFSDVSTTGWGSVYGDNIAFGHWSTLESSFHINWLEPLAAFLELKCFANCSILLRMDDTRFPHLNEVAGERWH